LHQKHVILVPIDFLFGLKRIMIRPDHVSGSLPRDVPVVPEVSREGGGGVTGVVFEEGGGLASDFELGDVVGGRAAEDVEAEEVEDLRRGKEKGGGGERE
jgi:hypothetical protein